MIWWCAEHKSGTWWSAYHTQVIAECARKHEYPYYVEGDCRMVEALLIVKDSPQIEIEVQSVHPMSIECYDLPWQSIKSDWRYLLVPLGPAEREEEG